MTLKDGYRFGGFSGIPPSEPNLSTPPPPGVCYLSAQRSVMHVDVDATPPPPPPLWPFSGLAKQHGGAPKQIRWNTPAANLCFLNRSADSHPGAAPSLNWGVVFTAKLTARGIAVTRARTHSSAILRLVFPGVQYTRNFSGKRTARYLYHGWL